MDTTTGPRGGYFAKMMDGWVGADYEDVCKVTTVYKGDCGPEALNANLPPRASYFKEPGPASTALPLPTLSYPSMIVEIDVFAMKEKD